MSKRDYGTGGVFRNGKNWMVRIRDEHGKKINLGTYSTQEEAERICLAARKELTEHQWVTPGGTTLRSYGESWLDRREKDGSHRGVDKERSRWKAHIEDAPFIDETLGSIRAADLRSWVRSLLNKKITRTKRTRDGTKRRKSSKTLSRGTVVHIRNLLSACFNAAVEDELIESNPLTGVKVPSVPRVIEKDEERTYLDTKEIEALINCESIPFSSRSIFAIAVFTGLRKGELWGLKRDDVVLDGDRPHLVVRRSNKGPTKSGKILRVPLLPRAIQAFKEWLKVAPASREGWVFPRADGRQRRKDDVAGWSDKKYRRKGELKITPGHKSRAGIERDVDFHELRHTFASHLIMGSWGRVWSMEEVRAFLGHSSITVTQRYAHLSPEALHKAAAETTGVTAAPVSRGAVVNRRYGGRRRVISSSSGRRRRRVDETAVSAATGGSEIGLKLALNSGYVLQTENANPPESNGTPDRIRTCDRRLRRPRWAA